MTYSATKFEVTTPNGLEGDTFTTKRDGRTDAQTDGRPAYFGTKLLYPFFLKKKAGIIKCGVMGIITSVVAKGT